MIRDMSSDHLEYLSVLGGKMSKLIVHQTRVIVAVSECGLLLDLRLFSQQISAYFLCVVSHEKDVPDHTKQTINNKITPISKTQKTQNKSL